MTLLAPIYMQFKARVYKTQDKIELFKCGSRGNTRCLYKDLMKTQNK